MSIQIMFDNALQTKRVSRIGDFYVATDPMSYTEFDQVIGIFPEQKFFLDEIVRTKIRSADLLEIGVGSGVLSIGCVRAGAKRVTALEINPRAKNVAGFNIVLNACEDKIAIVDGNADVFKPVAGRRFDYIISNPPFEPTPPGVDYYSHSSAGPYGMDFIDKITRGLDDHLTDEGHAQFVTAAPGDAKTPFVLSKLAEKYLQGTTTIRVNAVPLRFDAVMDRLPKVGVCAQEQADVVKQMAKTDGISHLHLCVMHCDKGLKQLTVEPAKRIYEQWEFPLAA